MPIEFVPLSDTRFVMLSEVSTLDEESVEFQRKADGSVVLLFHGQPCRPVDGGEPAQVVPVG